MSALGSRLTAKGQATIPKAVRDHLGHRPGDRVEFAIDPLTGVVHVLPARTSPVAELAGLLHQPGRPAIGLEEMDEIIGEAATDATR